MSTKRFGHWLLLTIGVVVPICAVVQNQLGTWPSIGIVVSAVVAMLVNVRKLLPSDTETGIAVLRILHRLGAASAVAQPILTAMLTTIPAGTKVSLFVSQAAALTASLQGAFGTEPPSPLPANDPGPGNVIPITKEKP